MDYYNGDTAATLNYCRDDGYGATDPYYCVLKFTQQRMADITEILSMKVSRLRKNINVLTRYKMCYIVWPNSRMGNFICYH